MLGNDTSRVAHRHLQINILSFLGSSCILCNTPFVEVNYTGDSKGATIFLTPYPRSRVTVCSQQVQETIPSLFNKLKAGYRLACHSRHFHNVALSLLAISELQLSAAMSPWLFHRVASLSSWLEVNCLQSATVGKAGRCLLLGLPSAASDACAVMIKATMPRAAS